MKAKILPILLTLFVTTLLMPVAEAIPPEHMNYQGVLRDASGNPLDGSYDMVFRYYSADTGGTFYLLEEHLDPGTGGTGQVIVSGGLFNVALGTGNLVDVAGLTTLGQVFSQPDVWLEVQVGAEILSPRVQVRGAGYALNAAKLDGRPPSAFLDTSTAGQTKTGPLTVNSTNSTALYGNAPVAGAYFTNTEYGTTAELANHSYGLETNGSILAAGNLTVDSIRTTGIDSIFINQDGPDEDAMIYWYDEGSSQGAHLKWRNYFSQFEFSHSIRTPGYVRAVEFRSDSLPDYHLKPGNLYTSAYLAGDVVIGQHLGDDDDYLYFDQKAAYLRWREANARFEFNSSLAITGSLQSDTGLKLTHPDLYLNQDGPEGDSSVYFFENGLSTGARLFWNDSQSRFETSEKLRVSDVIRAPVFQDDDDGAFYMDPGHSEFSGLLAGGLIIGHGSNTDNDVIQFDQQAESLMWQNGKTRFEFSDDLAISGTLQTGTTAQTATPYNRLGDGAPIWADIQSSVDLFVSDDLEVGGDVGLSKRLYMEIQETTGADGDQTIYFYDAGSPTSGYIQWDDVSTITCGTIGNINSGFRWNITDNTDSGWVFGNGTDYEAVIDELGNLEIDGSLHQSGSCDLAETFFGPSGLEAGTVVVLDPERPEGVRASTQPLDSTVAGVVTTRPGVLLSGPSADAYPVWEELEEVQEMLASLPPEPLQDATAEAGEAVSLDAEPSDLRLRRQGLEQRAAGLELQLDTWARGNVAVALVGRVPVKADASYGPIRKGDFLTTSATPGHAQVLDGPGPYLGIAMDDLEAGQGDILVFLEKGWYGGAIGPDGEDPAVEPAQAIAEVQEMESGLQIVLDRDRNDRATFSVTKDGGNGIGSEVFRVDEQGNVFATGSFRPAAMDLAEFHPVSEPVEPGDVLVVDREQAGRMALGRMASDPAVVGIVSTEPGVLLGSGLQRIVDADPELAAAFDVARAAGDSEEEGRLWAEAEVKFRQSHAAIALSGTVPCKVDAGYGSIQVGDLLTVSPTAGHAMRAADPAPQGTVLGKALEPLDSGTGTIQVLVMMR